MDPTENVNMMSIYQNELRAQYIQDNMQAYMDSYFGQNYASPSSNISVCDSGRYYKYYKIRKTLKTCKGKFSDCIVKVAFISKF